MLIKNSVVDNRHEPGLAEQARLFGLVFNNLQGAVVLMDKDFNIIRVSDAYASAFKHPLSFFPGKNYFNLYPSPLEEELARFIEDKKVFKRKCVPFVFPDYQQWGTTFWNLELVPILNDKESVEYLLLTLKDITWHKRVEDFLKENGEKFRLLAENAFDGIVITSDGGNVLYANRRASEITGYSVYVLLTMTIGELVDIETFVKVREELANRVAGIGPSQRHEIVMHCKDGSNSLLELTSSRTLWNGIPVTVAIFHDITERKRGERALLRKTQELKAANKELHELTVKLTQVESVERKHFAELLHEGIGQNLVTIKLAYDNFALGCSDKEVLEGLSVYEIRNLIDDTIKATRSMTLSLYPAPLKDMGMVKALRWYIENLLESSGVVVSLDIDAVVDTLPKKIQGALFSIIRESFQNIYKYASATEVTVVCIPVGEFIRLSIIDNGVGFVESEVKAKEHCGIGLSLMRQWVTGICGVLKINSTPDIGTEVCVEISDGVKNKSRYLLRK